MNENYDRHIIGIIITASQL